MAKKKGIEIKKYHNGDKERNLQRIFLRTQAIQEERGLVSRVAFRDFNSEQGVQIDHYQDKYGCFSNITYLTKTPLAGKNIHNRTRTPRPAYYLSVTSRHEKRMNNQQYRNKTQPKIAGTRTQKDKSQQMPYSIFITQQSMPHDWKQGN